MTAIDWLFAWSGAITAALGGGLAMASACLLFMIATALGPEVAVFQCVSPLARGFAKLTAFAWFIRGSLILTTISGPDARHAHWDLPVSWAMTTTLLCIALVSLWRERMNPEVRERFDRRERARRARVKTLLERGRISDAKLAASGHDATAIYYDLGLSDTKITRLNELP